MIYVGIDPGTEQSALAVLSDTGVVRHHYIIPNGREMESAIGAAVTLDGGPVTVAIEMVESFGMPVGRETFATVEYIGWLKRGLADKGLSVVGVTRKQVKLHLCGTTRANDSNIKQAILDLYGGSKAVGSKKEPGPLYGIKSHEWSALAVALTAKAEAAGAGRGGADRRFSGRIS